MFINLKYGDLKKCTKSTKNIRAKNIIDIFSIGFLNGASCIVLITATINDSKYRLEKCHGRRIVRSSLAIVLIRLTYNKWTALSEVDYVFHSVCERFELGANRSCYQTILNKISPLCT